MARADDQPRPAVTVDPHPPPAWMRGGRVVVALERLPQAAYVWDDDDDTILYDDPDPDRLVWDAPFVGEGYTDVWCDTIALNVIHGQPDERDQYRTSAALLELRDPGDGRYRTRTVDGRLVYYATGRRLAVWWQDPELEDWWLFHGQIATWRERLDGTVGIEAYSGRMVGRPHGAPWTAGAAGDFLSERVAAILAATVDPPPPYRADLGDVTLSVPDTADTVPLDAIRQAAWSDGGIVYTDADDTLIIRDRRWRNGRTDQTGERILTNNVCDAGVMAIVVADPETTDDFMRQAGTVRLENDADPALVAVAAVPPGTFIDTDVTFTNPGKDLWQTQLQGNTLAAFILAERSMARVALATADVYLHDRRFDYFALATDLRLGDRARFQHDDPFGFYDVTVIVTTLQHQLTPESWVLNVGTSPAVDYTAVELYDDTLLTWDDPDPLAVWR